LTVKVKGRPLAGIGVSAERVVTMNCDVYVKDSTTIPEKLTPSQGAGHFTLSVMAPFTSPTNSNPTTSAKATSATFSASIEFKKTEN
jgi:hypothetical protein